MTEISTEARAASPERRRNQLDGLRTLLFVCVFTVHTQPDAFEYLTYALPTFFVMSGFLITRVLWLCQADTLWAKLKIFYARRVIRIVPAYAFVVALLILIDHVQHPAAYAFYYLNIKLFLVSLHQDQPEFITWWAAWDRQDLHLWSMSVEEQFYLIFPLIFYVVPRRHFGKAFLAAVLFGVTSRTWFMHYYPASFYGFLLSSCVEYFAWGALFSYLDLTGRLPAKPSPWWSLYVPVALICGLVSIEYRFEFDGYFHQQTTHFMAIVAPLLGLAIWGLWSADASTRLVRVLNWRPFVYIGHISYPMYLTHLTFIVYCNYTLGPWILRTVDGSVRMQYAVSYVLAVSMTFLASAFIWHVIEVPALRLKRHFPLDPSRPRRGATDVATAAPQPG